jgi:hypothetical protein
MTERVVDPSDGARRGVLSWTDLGMLLAECISAGCDDYHLATLVRADGMARLDAGQRFGVEDYEAALPDLREREMTLDAVIDLSLEALSAGGLPMAAAVERLTAHYPSMQSLIRRAAALALLVEQATLNDPSVEAPADEVGITATATLSAPHRFELVGFLGRGSFADVLLVRDRSGALGPGLVALKVLRCIGNDAAKARFYDEAEKTRQVDHPNVLRVLDASESGTERPWIAFEYLEGGSLAERRATLLERIEPPGMLRLLESVCRGVHAIHEAGMIHCDIKPANILLAPELVPKVADLGVAFSAGRENDRRIADSSQFVGTIGFMAPEQFRAKTASPTRATDIYALGGLLAWVLTGEVPNGASWVEIAASLVPQIHGRGERIALTLADHHPEIARIWRQATHPDPSVRHRSAVILAEEVSHARRGWVR